LTQGGVCDKGGERKAMKKKSVLFIVFALSVLQLSCYEIEESKIKIDFINKKVTYELSGFFPPSETGLSTEDSLKLAKYSYEDIKLYNTACMIFYFLKIKFHDMLSKPASKKPLLVNWKSNSYKLYKTGGRLGANLLFDLKFDSLSDTIKKYVFNEFFSTISVDSEAISLVLDSIGSRGYVVLETNGSMSNDTLKCSIHWPKQSKFFYMRFKNKHANEELMKRTADCFKPNGQLNKDVVPKIFIDEWKNGF
jgi:hypothetical protein